MTTKLKEKGFTMATPTNSAAYDEFLDVSKIYVVPGSEAVANSVAYLMGGIAVLRMPTPAPINGATAGLNGATVLVMLGRDLVGKKLPGHPKGS
jgi:hypothetical protein